MKWTEQIPNRPGFYWVRQPSKLIKKGFEDSFDITIRQVHEYRGQFAIGTFPLKDYVRLHKTKEWAGPIPSPDENASRVLLESLEAIRDVTNNTRLSLQESRDNLRLCNSISKMLLGLLHNKEI